MFKLKSVLKFDKVKLMALLAATVVVVFVPFVVLNSEGLNDSSSDLSQGAPSNENGIVKQEALVSSSEASGEGGGITSISEEACEEPVLSSTEPVVSSSTSVVPDEIVFTDPKQAFIAGTADFSIDLFKKSLDQGKNCMVSPTSVYMALGMTTNGANGQTLKEFEVLLGRYGLTVGELNGYYKSLSERLTEQEAVKLNIANSIWYRNDQSFKVKPDFIKKNTDYFGAGIFAADFNSPKTVNDINNWVKDNTEGLIDKAVDQIDPETVMYLINAMYFDAEWQKIYSEQAIKEGKFTLANKNEVTAQFMSSSESIYLEHDKATGFMKPYKGGKFSFVALLPNEGISPEKLVASLSGREFIEIISGKESNVKVLAKLPKFETEYGVGLVDPLKDMGLVTCFDGGKADFSRMGHSEWGNIYVSDAFHKTFIKVDERGTKAGAVTVIEASATAMPEKEYRVYLDRPFVYAIIDNETSLPVFLGIVNNPAE